MDNENPTILNASDLPSRKRQPKRTLSSSLATGLLSSVAPTACTNDPFVIGNVSDPLSNGDEDECDGDDFNVDHIDEQEIYGQCFYPIS